MKAPDLFEEFQEIKYNNSIAYDKLKEAYKTFKTDSNNFVKINKVLKESPYKPKSLLEYKNLKDNEPFKFEQLQREYTTIKEITEHSEWSEIFKKKSKINYYKFRKDNIEVSKHFLQNYSGRVDKKEIKYDKW